MLHEKYRPREWSEVVGHSKMVSLLRRKVDSGELGGRAYWITGPSGAGKTSVAYLLAGEIADPFNWDELDAGQITPAMLTDIRRTTKSYGIGNKSGRVVIVNEAHGLRKDAIRQLLVILEDIPRHVVWLFTTTNDGQAEMLFDDIDSSPLISRCVPIRLDGKGCAAPFAQRAQEIAEAEGLGGANPSDYLAMVKRYKCNFRRCLSEIEAGAMMREEVPELLTA